MTAQAGAVAYAREHDALRPTFHDVVLPDSQEAEMWAYALVPLYAVPPAAVPVEALEGLAAKWRAVAEKQRARMKNAAAQDDDEDAAHWGGLAERSEYCADELTQLIKERSNG